MMKRTLTLALVCGAYGLSPAAGATAGTDQQTFRAPWETASWRVNAEGGRCALTHDIPFYGQARFEQRTGHRLAFELHAEQPVRSGKLARVIFEAPPWKHRSATRPLGDFPVQPGKMPLRLVRDQALRIYAELEQGMRPVIEFDDRSAGRDPVQIALSPVRFRAALPKFLTCTAGLLYLDFEPLDEKRVYFATDSDHLSRPTRRHLEQLARRYRKQRNFRIVLSGYADERGTDDYNMALSQRRAAMVGRYLRSRGVPRAVIEIRYYGEVRRPGSKGDKKTWADNRRVTIWLAARQS